MIPYIVFGFACSIVLGYLYYPKLHDSKSLITKIEGIKNEKDVVNVVKYACKQCKDTDELQSLLYETILEHGITENTVKNINRITKSNMDSHNAISYACTQLWSSIILAESKRRPLSIIHE
jgi:hypothetical protein